MSLRIDYLTNGTRNIYRVRNSGVDPVAIDIYEDRDDIPMSIRHYAPYDLPKFVGPDMARFYGILDELYPNFPTCGHPDYFGDKCVAECCQFCVEEGDWETCPYFKKENSNV